MTSRRTFLQMLGIGGMGIVAADPLALPLFGSSSDRGLWVPGSSKLLDGHWVVAQKTGFIEKPLGGVHQPVPSHKMINSDEVVVARLIKHRRPSRYFAQRSADLDQPLRAESREDLHTAYFMASMRERQRFAQQSLEFLSFRPNAGDVVLREHKYEPWSAKVALVTIVDQPIRYDGGGYRNHLTGSYTQFLVQDEPEDVMRTFDIYSEQGDFPVDPIYRNDQTLEFDALARASAVVASVDAGQRENAARSFFKRLFS